MSTKHDALERALGLAARGVAVFPCGDSKAPTRPKSEGGEGYKDATTNPDVLRDMWNRWPGTLIGVATGAINGFDVLDIDGVKHPEAKEWWLEHRRYIPRTRVHQTRSGGLHVLFQHNAQARTGNGRLGIGLDVKTNGGYVVWWPLCCPVLVNAPIAPWPAWLIAKQQPKPTVVRPFVKRGDDDDRIVAALKHINADDRDTWLHIGMALKSHYGDAGRALWDRWAQQSNKYNARDQDRVWRSLSDLAPIG